MNSGGSYNVAEAEQSQHTFYVDTIVCNVYLLDSTCVAFKVDKHCRGQSLLDLTFDYLELLERDFFGLVFNARHSRGETILKWLDPTKVVGKQCSDPAPYTFWFRVKFYVPDPVCLHEEYTRYQFFLQVRKDILEGRLPVPKATASHLAGLVLQAELGDYIADECHPGYTSQFRLLPHQSPEFDSQASEWHRKCSSMVPCAAELEFLNVARQLERYGVKTNEISDAKDGSKNSLIGVSHAGVIVFRNNASSFQLPWSNILKIRFRNKKFIVHLKSATVNLLSANGSASTGTRTPSYSTLVASPTDSSKTGLQQTFQFPSSAEAKEFWQYAVACHAFFRVREPAEVSFNRAPAYGAGGTTAISATAIYSAISRATSGLRRFFSIARRGSIYRTGLGGAAGGVERTLSTVMELRRNSRVFDRGFSRSSSRRSTRRSMNFSGSGPSVSHTGGVRTASNLSLDRPPDAHTPNVSTKTYNQLPPGVRTSLVFSTSSKTPDVQLVRGVQASAPRNPPESVPTVSIPRTLTSAPAPTGRPKKSPSPSAVEAAQLKTNLPETSTHVPGSRNSYISATPVTQAERMPRPKPPKTSSPSLNAPRSSQRRSHPSSPSLPARTGTNLPNSPKNMPDSKSREKRGADGVQDNAQLSSSDGSDPDQPDFDRDDASRYWNARWANTAYRVGRTQTRARPTPSSIMHESFHGRTSQEESRTRPSNAWSGKRQLASTELETHESLETTTRTSSSTRAGGRLTSLHTQQSGSQRRLVDLGSSRYKDQSSHAEVHDRTHAPGRTSNTAGSTFVRDPLHPGAPAGDGPSNPIEADSTDGLVRIRIRPDSRGRFGFNIRGGIDFGIPIIVSRVGQNTPADLCIPRLYEGDQLIAINGRSVTGYTHTEVVAFLNVAREDTGCVLELLVKPSDYVTDYFNGETNIPDSGDAPPLPPRSSMFSTRQPVAGDRLSVISRRNSVSSSKRASNASYTQTTEPLLLSILDLEHSLADGSILSRFEQLPRRKPGFTTIASRLNENILKNRYRDISPYDQTRVILKQGTGDYINASYVIMDFPKAGFSLNYIAAQGPLPSTYGDFWQMCWEQHVSVVVMLTAVSEKGRVKCHQYWPDLGQTLRFSAFNPNLISSRSSTGHPTSTELQIQTVQEEVAGDFAFREFTISQLSLTTQRSSALQNNPNPKTTESRRITQLQYITWPDHGVPNNPTDFISFVERVRDKRGTDPAPVVVHCSAGIGRTGVLITMETAMNLIERGHPIRPLELVQLMRSQRGLLIQTTSQFQFVCEMILKVFQRDQGDQLHS
ncbi:Tyrosine-protein phosphatase non-receptor type 4 [Clonorchis sinensis]|uniref:protein-tyrosine-phosphatase n=1 Tax=Clonorchis sinensis TaxID=79923 RepID=A0A8T1M9H9_CLOSI|nr:Tyrosine-protein phosphatase non-receptor type 4 [Clonorchis sinensis]